MTNKQHQQLARHLRSLLDLLLFYVQFILMSFLFYSELDWEFMIVVSPLALLAALPGGRE